MATIALPLRVHLDTCIYYSIRQTRFPADYSGQFGIPGEDLQVVLEKARTGGIVFYEAPSNLTEIFKCINKDPVGVNRLLRISEELTHNLILQIPIDYVRDKLNAGLATTLVVRNTHDGFLHIRGQILNGQPFDPWVIFEEYEKLTTKFIASLNAFRPDFIGAVFESYCGLFYKERYQAVIQAMFETDYFKDNIKLAFIDRFGLGDLSGAHKDLLSAEPYYELFTAYYKALLRKVVNVDKVLEVNDFLDEEQVIYIDDLDYLVSVDRRFSSIYSVAFEGSPRSGKFASWDELVSICNSLS